MKYFNNEFQVLSAQELLRVHSLTLEVLERKGVLFHSEEAKKILAAHGAKVDGDCVRFSAPMVEKTIAQSPANFLWQARDEKKSLMIGDEQNNVYSMQDNGPVFIQERNGQRRLGNFQDVCNFYKLGQTSKVTTIVGQCTVDPHELDDVPNKHKLITQKLLQLTDKPIISWPQMSNQNTKDVFDMVEMVMGTGYLASHYFITASVCALSPLQYSQESADTIIAYAKANQPVMLLTCPISGVSAPIGEIASLVMQNAEILSGLVLAQCIQPGIPVIYGISQNMGDLRTGTFVTSSPEAKLVDRASIQLVETLYHIPTRFMAGNTDSKLPDIQAGYETMQNYIFLLMGGTQMINECLGILDGMMTVSYEKYIIDEELLERMQIMMSGLDISESAFDISDILDSPHGESFLMCESTLNKCGKQWIPAVSEWNNYDTWESKGCPDILDKAAKICAERLESAPENLLGDDLNKSLIAFAEK